MSLAQESMQNPSRVVIEKTEGKGQRRMASSSNRKRRNPNDHEFVNGLFGNESSDDHQIKVITAMGEIIPVTVKGSDTIDEMKLKIQHAKAHVSIDNLRPFLRQKVPKQTNKTGLASESMGFMDIFINNLEGRITYFLEVMPSDTIGNLRAKMYEYVHVLMFNGVVLEDSDTLADLHIINGSTLTGIAKAAGEMEIYVNHTLIRKTISLLVTPKDTIANVKLKIGYEEKLICYEEKLKRIWIPFGEQVLIFNGMALEDSGTLFDFNIKGESTLTLLRRSRRSMQISIKTFSKGVITVEVNPSYTIGNVKSKIQNEIDIPHDEQELIFNEMVLDNFDTIADFDINEESTLTLVRKSKGHMHIFINMSSKTINVKVKPSDSVYNVISKIADMQGVPRCQLKLLFNGRGLNDNLTLADYQIHDKSTIESCLQLKG